MTTPPKHGLLDEVPIRLREELGSEVHVHGAIRAAAHVSGSAPDDVHSLATIVANVDPRSAIAVGQTAAVAVDAAQLHFFDPESGESIRR